MQIGQVGDAPAPKISWDGWKGSWDGWAEYDENKYVQLMGEGGGKSALRRAMPKVKNRKKDCMLQAEKGGKAKETLAGEKLVVEKASVLDLVTIAVALASHEVARTARARARLARASECLRNWNVGQCSERCHA